MVSVAAVKQMQGRRFCVAGRNGAIVHHSCTEVCAALVIWLVGNDGSFCCSCGCLACAAWLSDALELPRLQRLGVGASLQGITRLRVVPGLSCAVVSDWCGAQVALNNGRRVGGIVYSGYYAPKQAAVTSMLLC